MTQQTHPAMDTLILTTPKLSDESMSKLKKTFKTIHQFDKKDDVTPEALKEAEVWFSNYDGVNEGLKPEEVGKLRLVQLSSAGANNALANPFWEQKQAQKQVSLCTASGIHAYTIPQYIIAQIINLYMNVHNETFLCRSEKKWPERSRIAWDPLNTGSGGVAFPSVRGKTAGMLGYGAIGREAARLLKTMGCTIIAANSSGQKKADDGYILPGTGDKEGDLPSEWYSTSDPKSFDDFFRKSDIVVASLPGTPATTYLVESKHLNLLPLGGIFINVGRGSLVRSSDLVESLKQTEQPGSKGLFAAALDVTDPEPLTDGHELFSHPRVIITPHTSGVYAGYFDAATELLVANVENVRQGKNAYNVVNIERGY